MVDSLDIAGNGYWNDYWCTSAIYPEATTTSNRLTHLVARNYPRLDHDLSNDAVSVLLSVLSLLVLAGRPYVLSYVVPLQGVHMLLTPFVFVSLPLHRGVRWHNIRQIHKHPKGLMLTTTINWAVQPFLMYGLAVLFFEVIYASILDLETQKQYIAGAVILGGSPCTAMVFVWSTLGGGDASYTLVQVVLNDLILLFLYVPTVQLLLHVSNISLPWGTVFLSVVLFVVVPFFFGIATYAWIFHQGGEHGEEYLERIKRALSTASASALIILVVFIFMSQAQVLIGNFVNVFLIIVPLILQTAIVFCMTYSIAYFICLEHNVAGPAAFIGSSNFFELAVALALSVYGPDSGAVLVTVCGVLVEVPVMLCEVAIVNETKGRYEQRLADESCGCDNKDEGSIRLGREDGGV
jgi:ACR3 family arsenite transporter